MLRTQISLTPQQFSRLRELARAGGVSQAAILREALDAYLGVYESTMRLDHALVPVGAYRSGGHSTADEHDEVLDEAFGA